MKANHKIQIVSRILILALAAIGISAQAADFPNFPKQAIQFKETTRVNSGRYATVTMTVNTNGTFRGDYKVENMQFLAGCHIAGRLEFFATNGDLLALVKMPRIGLKPAWFAKRVERHADISGAIKPNRISELRKVKFTGFEDADGTLGKDLKEVLAFFKAVKVAVK